MKASPVPLFITLLMTVVILLGLLASDPFLRLRYVFAKGASPEELARVSTYATDPQTQEITNGERPLEGLRQLGSYWCNVRKELRYVITGNSQTFTVLLAPSEAHLTDAESTYPDLLLNRINSAGFHAHGYRLSAPNISYMEVLWYLTYLISHPCLTPNEFIVQLNFETFRKTSIREGLLELLNDRQFAAAIEQEAQSSATHSGIFQQAIDHYKSSVTKQQGGAAETLTSKTGLAKGRGAGSAIETLVRAALDNVELFRARGRFKAELLDFLYLARVHLLGITPSTKRSLSDGALKVAVSSLKRVGELCKTSGIRLVLFNAPQNPNAPLYRTPSDRDEYRELVSKLVHDQAQAYYDFEDSIPGPMWGVWIDGPDPIHFGRAAHRRLADLMFEQQVVDLKD